MPIFEMVCEKCGKFAGEYLLKIDQGADCPDCGKPLTKVVSKTNFSLKGDGWAKDGYK